MTQQTFESILVETLAELKAEFGQDLDFYCMCHVSFNGELDYNISLGRGYGTKEVRVKGASLSGVRDEFRRQIEWKKQQTMVMKAETAALLAPPIEAGSTVSEEEPF